MANPFFNALANKAMGNMSGPMGNMQQMMQAFQQFKADPVAALKQKGINIPDGMTNPQEIAQHMINSGQMPQSRLNEAMQMANQLQGMLK